ncbi:Probable cytochrome P450 301a1, mitochondrial [Gryllus bimaculatus]|nr:Probable cytochrome P450 301a1, mitochondrial [Gryllus bimaculatus]
MLLTTSVRAACARAGAGAGRARSSVAAATASAAAPSDAADARSADWERARPFQDIPGPKPLPLLGNTPRFLPGIGEYGKKDMLELQNMLRRQYGDMVRVSNVLGRKDMLWVFDPKITEKMYRNEGKWPIREGIKTIHYYRTVQRKEKFEGALGTVSTQGKEWYDFRTQVNQPLMQRKSANQYYTPVNDVAEDFIARMRDLRDENNELPADFINELYKWSLESITMVALDTRIGCLAPNLPKNSEPQGMIDSVQVMLEAFYKLDLKPSLWRIMSTPMWRRFVGAMDYLTDVAEKYINEAIANKKKNPDRPPSILEKLMEKDPKVARVMASDMLIGGVDTTSHLSASLLFHLAKNPEVQRRLREEMRRVLPSKTTVITEDLTNEMPYLKACLKESLRIFPIAMGNVRETPADVVLGDYQVPKGTDVMMCHMVMSRDEKNFARPMEFVPERWVRGSPEAHTASPFATMPFGFGPRMCIGRRFAEMEVFTLVAKVIRNFWVEYHYGDELLFESKTLNSISMPLKFRLIDQD